MPIAAVATVAAAGIGAVASSKAASKASDAASTAAANNNATQLQIYNTTRQDLAPYNQAGQLGLAALQHNLGLAPGAPAPAAGGVSTAKIPGGFAGTSPTEPPSYANTDTFHTDPAGLSPTGMAGGATGASGSAGVDYQKLFTDRPDVKAAYDSLASSADPNSPWYSQHGLDRGPNGFADWWLANKPAEDTYQAPMSAQSGATGPAAGATPNAPALTDPSTYAPRPAALEAPTYTRLADLTAPNVSSYVDPSKFTADPGYQYRVDQALQGVNANFAARGLVRSGGALQTLAGRASDLASQEYNNWFARQMQTYNAANSQYQYGQNRSDQNFVDDRSYGTNLWNTEQARSDANFNTDRGFTANRNDQGTANLFQLAGIGQSAAAGTAAAGNNYANSTAANNNNAAAATGNAAIANANNVTNLFGSAAGAYGMYAGMRGSNSSYGAGRVDDLAGLY